MLRRLDSGRERQRTRSRTYRKKLALLAAADLLQRQSRVFRYRAPNAAFSCALQAEPCRAPGCAKIVRLGLPYCSRHLFTELNLCIQKSRIPGAGLGVFAMSERDADVVFKRGALLCDYGGERLTYAELIGRYGDSEYRTAPYAIAHGATFLDAACRRGIGAMVNHSAEPNAHFQPYRGRMVLQALRDIRDGEEVLVDYGSDYVFHEKGVSFRTDKGV